jgi:hypothetical protein
MAWLLDTNILSEKRKPKPEPRVAAFYEAQPLNTLYISSQSPSLKFASALNFSKLWRDAPNCTSG